MAKALGKVTRDGFNQTVLWFEDDGSNQRSIIGQTLDGKQLFLIFDLPQIYLSRSKVESLIAHFQSWLATGSLAIEEDQQAETEGE